MTTAGTTQRAHGRAREGGARPLALLVALSALLMALAAPSDAVGAEGFGQLSGANGCLVAPGHGEGSLSGCGEGKGLVGPGAVAISPDGKNVYVASGTYGTTVATSYGSVAILKRDAATGSVSEIGCLSSDGTDGRDGASGACTPTPSLLGADGVTVSPDGSTVFVTASFSASVVAFSRNPETGALTRVGCFQYRPPAGSGCTAANVFIGSGATVTSADGRALYIAASTEGAVSTLTGSLIVPPAPTGVSGAPAGSTGAGSAPTTSAAEASVASIFGIPAPPFVANPCVAVNGFDGSCTFGVATGGLDALALAPGGEQLYTVSSTSNALNVFAHGTSGVLTESSCLMGSPPPGLCKASSQLSSPTQLAISPDAKNVYVADAGDGGGKVDIFARDPTTGALSDAGCVDYLAPPEKHESGEEEGEEGEGGEEQQGSAPDRCTSVPGLVSVESIAVTAGGSLVYALGSQSAVAFARDPATGKLSEVSCAAAEDSRCMSFPSLDGLGGAAVSPDGRFIYAAASKSNALVAFGVGLTVTTSSASASRAGVAAVHVRCPRTLRRPCAGHLQLTRAVLARRRRGAHHARIERLIAGSSGGFSLRPGAHATIAVRLSPATRRLLRARGRLRLLAVVRARPYAGGTGYGRSVALRLQR
jgi:DNA-binding beta-propeller fold protein YncE